MVMQPFALADAAGVQRPPHTSASGKLHRVLIPIQFSPAISFARYCTKPVEMTSTTTTTEKTRIICRLIASSAVVFAIISTVRITRSSLPRNTNTQFLAGHCLERRWVGTFEKLGTPGCRNDEDVADLGRVTLPDDPKELQDAGSGKDPERHFAQTEQRGDDNRDDGDCIDRRLK